MYGPIIEGKLVRLRPPKPEDAEAMIRWFEDMEVTRFLMLRNPPSIDMEKEWLDKMARSPDDVVWVVEHQGQAVGTTAIHMIDWKNGSATTGTVKIASHCSAASASRPSAPAQSLEYWSALHATTKSYRREKACSSVSTNCTVGLTFRKSTVYPSLV